MNDLYLPKDFILYQKLIDSKSTNTNTPVTLVFKVGPVILRKLKLSLIMKPEILT